MQSFPLRDETVETISPASPVRILPALLCKREVGNSVMLAWLKFLFRKTGASVCSNRRSSSPGGAAAPLYILGPRFVDEDVDFLFSSTLKQLKKGEASPRTAVHHERSSILSLFPLSFFLFPLLCPPYPSLPPVSWLLAPSFSSSIQPSFFGLTAAFQLQTLLVCLSLLMLPGTTVTSLSLLASSVFWSVWKPPGETGVQQAEPKLPSKHSDFCPDHLLRPKWGAEPWSLFFKLLLRESSDGGDTFVKQSRLAHWGRMDRGGARPSSMYVHVNGTKWSKWAFLCPPSAGGAAFQQLLVMMAAKLVVMENFYWFWCGSLNSSVLRT